MPKTKKKPKKNAYKEQWLDGVRCRLCGKSSRSLKQNSFCHCIATEQDYCTQEFIINGQKQTARRIKGIRITDLKTEYRRLVDGLSMSGNTVLAKKGVKKRTRKKATQVIGRTEKKEFYESWDWKRMRYLVLVKHGAVCMLCGATKKDSVICVDHIKPLGEFWDMRLEEDNLQVLCSSCNMGKSNESMDDFRSLNTPQ